MKGKTLCCFADRFIHAGKPFSKCSEPFAMVGQSWLLEWSPSGGSVLTKCQHSVSSHKVEFWASLCAKPLLESSAGLK